MARQTSAKVSILLILLAMIFTIGINQQLFALPQSCANASLRCQIELSEIEKSDEKSNLDLCGPLASFEYFICN
jgi:hypothetical protein